MNIPCLIVDDEPLAIQVIRKYISAFEQLTVAGTARNAIDALSLLQSQRVEVLFVDIQMPLVNGLEFIRTLEQPPLVVITTAYREFALDGFDLNVLDYLVKPIPFARFSRTVARITELVRLRTAHTEAEPASADDFVFIKVDKRMVKLHFADIDFIESLKDYVRIRTPYETLITHHNLADMARILPPDRFLRIHRSYTVSLEKIRLLEGNRVEVAGKYLPIGRNFQKEVKKRILKRNEL